MSAPFRELFVELPVAVFDALHAFGEALLAREQAQHPVTVQRQRSSFDWLNRMERVLAVHYGWFEVIRTERSQLDHYTTLVVRLGCMHAQRYRLDELSMLRAGTPASQVDLVCSIIENTERSCYCVQLPTETP